MKEGSGPILSLDDWSAKQARIRNAGLVAGRHFSYYVEDVMELKRERQHNKAISLLLKLIDATEAQSEAGGPKWDVAPWYYEQLAIIYRKEKRYWDEISVLERYQSLMKDFSAERLTERLEKAKKRIITRS